MVIVGVWLLFGRCMICDLLDGILMAYCWLLLLLVIVDESFG